MYYYSMVLIRCCFLPGFLYDTYQSFTPVFLMSAMTYVLANCILVPLSRVIVNRTSRREQVLVKTEQSWETIDSQFVTSL